jgi:hypothetical protein
LRPPSGIVDRNGGSTRPAAASTASSSFSFSSPKTSPAEARVTNDADIANIVVGIAQRTPRRDETHDDDHDVRIPSGIDLDTADVAAATHVGVLVCIAAAATTTTRMTSRRARCRSRTAAVVIVVVVVVVYE